MALSADLTWLIIRNHNSHMIKRPNIRKPFSSEPNNLKSVSSFRYSGLVHKRTVGIVPADKKGFTVVYKRSKYANRPAKKHRENYIEELVEESALSQLIEQVLGAALCSFGK